MEHNFFDISKLDKGDVVRISDGKPRPPKHHTRKLADWERLNMIGVFERRDSYGYVTIGRPDLAMPGMISFSFTLPERYVVELLPPDHFTRKAEDAA
jgi:hypothetical protein